MRWLAGRLALFSYLVFALSPTQVMGQKNSAAAKNANDDQASSVPRPAHTYNVAVIGAGIGGSSIVAFLNEFQAEDRRVGFNFDVFEHLEDRVGGRVASVNMDVKEDIDGGTTAQATNEEKGGEKIKARFEAGASIAVEANRYVRTFAENLGLERIKPKSDTLPENRVDRMALYNGEGLVWQESGTEWWDKLRILWRYKFGLFNAMKLANEALEGFNKIYDLQADGEAYREVPDLLRAQGLYDLTKDTAQKVFAESLGTEADGSDLPVVKEILTVMMRNNYNSDVWTINGLAGLVGLIPLASDAGGMWSVKGGNCQIPELLLKNATNAKLHMGVTVKQVLRQSFAASHMKTSTESERLKDDNINFKLSFGDGNKEMKSLERNTYDFVVVATPLELSHGLELNGYDSEGRLKPLSELNSFKIPDRSYRYTHTTFVAGVLSGKYFGVTQEEIEKLSSFETVLPMPIEKAFSSIGTQAFLQTNSNDDKGKRIIKIFSREKIEDSFLKTMFVSFDADSVVRIPWQAYPVFNPPEKFSPIILDEGGLYYNNALESAASAMEMSAVSARNIANLIRRQIIYDIGPAPSKKSSKRKSSDKKSGKDDL